ncbi:3-hydroxyanthranilate 3,4-dioxygenase [Thalassotalea sp. LPB0316]|uniref:3-hydroxyanthranilate 3,4-dioxygenase n=1 Tax=Thalassotalea sp. LPB0316 TaxID=2769490 RepID=UPI0018683E82|nr:3-hydroxyanthranilate 3,4-dioxygenase [Thalassotalea sp. LPB0316]QOL24491.1 3-hydroxyanthranilate 3,4-dioxygenase [Thalassotalea sp. LPB0316]
MLYSMPINISQWIEDHREQLKPPVCNKQVFEQDDFIVMIVGGPNNRSDYHYNETPELFYQIEGDMILQVIEHDDNNQPIFKDITIKQGELFLLPPKVLHSPQRFENTIGMVVEQKRGEQQLDELHWYCRDCHALMYREAFALANIETDLPKVFERFFTDHAQCKACGFSFEIPDKYKK